MSENINVKMKDSILNIQFNRPEKKNAVTYEMYNSMREALVEAGEDKSIKVVLFTGQADCFTSGNDLGDFLNNPPQTESNPVLNFLKCLVEITTPVVAAPCGISFGLGTTMLLHCDLVYAGDNGRFRFPFVDIGLCPEAGVTGLLPQLVGYQKAAELLLLAREFTASESREMNLVNEVLPPEEASERAWAVARELTGKPPKALAATKSLLHKGKIALIHQTMAEETRQFIPLIKGEEAREAFSAFLEKRKPDFSQFE